MKNNLLKSLIVLSALSLGACKTLKTNNNTPSISDQKNSTETLKSWKFYGNGETFTWGDQFGFKEAENTKGVMIVSPDAYAGDVTIRYDIMALTPATVFVAMLDVSDKGSSTKLTLPAYYDGDNNLWSKEKDNYFFAFKNSPHNSTPFLKKNPTGENFMAKITEEDKMMAGVYYTIEVGKKNGVLWLSIDGKKLFSVADKQALSGGHIALRIRGVASFGAACLIRNLVIEN